MPHFRGFIAIDIDSTSKMQEFEKEIERTGADVKLVEPENVHITLKFLGDVDEGLVDQIVTILTNAVKEIDPFLLKLKQTGVFPNENYIKVLWIGIENGDTMKTLSKTLDERLSTLGFPREKREFSPHLTIGRVKTAKNKEQLLKTIGKYEDIIFGEFTIDSIVLKKSDLTPKGPIYTTVKEVRL